MEKLDFSKGNGLIPVIVQDSQTLKVLMLGYMNEEAYVKTSDSGLVTFFSRSRQTLWTKGETSGNFLHVEQILVDCDKDTLLVKAKPDGPVCHAGPDTCFKENNDSGIIFLDYLQDLIIDRKRSMPEGSYTTRLFESGTGRIAQKVGEEAVELVIEGMGSNEDGILNEAADLVFHTMVLLAEKNLEFGDVVKVLKDRHK
jgi:phosphoribosyl-ATP pyrophosphohydrolase/phosphoribosyl-AMP cyclohydrolase